MFDKEKVTLKLVKIDANAKYLFIYPDMAPCEMKPIMDTLKAFFSKKSKGQVMVCNRKMEVVRI